MHLIRENLFRLLLRVLKPSRNAIFFEVASVILQLVGLSAVSYNLSGSKERD
jgi:hypothetical protein